MTRMINGMRIVRHLAAIDTAYHGAAVTIGAFDGLHVGHRALLDALTAAPPPRVVVTFEPPPRVYFGRAQRLLSLRDKLDLLADYPFDLIVLLAFSRVAATSAVTFITTLAGTLTMRRLIVGAGFRFGNDRRGDEALLRDYGAHHGFTVTAVPPVMVDGERVSSSRIRSLLQAGDIDTAQRLLGRRYMLSGRVVHGDGRGRQLGFPTMNIQPGFIVPLRGVYAAYLTAGGIYDAPAVVNVGVKPTVGGTAVTVEAHLLDQTLNAYGQRVCLTPVAKLRDERTFASLAALQQAIHDDIICARKALDATPVLR